HDSRPGSASRPRGGRASPPTTPIRTGSAGRPRGTTSAGPFPAWDPTRETMAAVLVELRGGVLPPGQISIPTTSIGWVLRHAVPPSRGPNLLGKPGAAHRPPDERRACSRVP